MSVGLSCRKKMAPWLEVTVDYCMRRRNSLGLIGRFDLCVCCSRRRVGRCKRIQSGACNHRWVVEATHNVAESRCRPQEMHQPEAGLCVYAFPKIPAGCCDNNAATSD